VPVLNHSECDEITVTLILLEASNYMFELVIDRISESHPKFDKSYTLEL